jgi:hypothetical protein
MHDTKPWYTSLTIWGAIVSLIASALALFRVRLDPQLQADLRDWLLAASTLAGGAASLWGRLRASRRILTPQTIETRPGKPRPQDWRMNGLLPFAPMLLLLPLSQCTGCSALTFPPPDYVAADRATYEAVAPEYAGYVQEDPRLDEDERVTRARTLQTWDARLRAAERGKSEARNSKSETNLKDQTGNDPNAEDVPLPF